MGFLMTPSGGLKESVLWWGKTITNIKGLFINVYQLNTSSLAGVQQVVTITGSPTSFTLAFGGNTTTAITYSGVTCQIVQAALQALDSIGSGNVAVAGGPNQFVVTFLYTLGTTSQSTMTGAVTGGGSISIANAATGQQTAIVQSGDLAATVSNSLEPNYFNFPSSSYFQAFQGAWYSVEMCTLGSGTYSLVGLPSHWLGANTATVPQQIGARRTLPIGPGSVSTTWYSVEGPGNSVSTATCTAAHACAVGDNCLIVVVDAYSASHALTTLTATYNSISMTQLYLSANYIASSGGFEYLAIFGLIGTSGSNPFTGVSHNVVVTETGLTGTKGLTVDTISYQNVASFGAVQSVAVTTSATITQTVTGINGGLLFNAMASGTVSGSDAIGDYNQGYGAEQISSIPATAINDCFAYGDAYAYSGIVFTAPGPGSPTAAPWVSATVPINLTTGNDPIEPLSISSPSYASDVPLFALCGSAGISGQAPATKLYRSGSHTYQVPVWMIAGDRFDVVLVGAGGGGNVYDIPEGGVSAALGGDAGTWLSATLVYGVDVPLTTTTFSVVVGAGGQGGIVFVDDAGYPGTNSTVTITGYGTLTAAGGAGGAGDAADDPSYGQAAGDVTVNGADYIGGAEQETWYTGGNAPGGGGSIGFNLGDPSFQPGNAGSGANGAVWITAYQP
jgi:hypothetical protein